MSLKQLRYKVQRWSSTGNAHLCGGGSGTGSSVGYTHSKKVRLCVCVCARARVSRSVVFDSRILEWVAISFSRGSSPSRDQTPVSCIAGRFFAIWATREARRITRETLGEGQGPSARFGTRAQTRAQTECDNDPCTVWTLISNGWKLKYSITENQTTIRLQGLNT